MSINIPKCGYMVTNQPLPTYRSQMLTLNNHPIPHVTSYKYLGVRFKSTGIDFVKQGILLSQRVESCLAGMLWFSDTWAPQIRLNIVKSILLPTLEYSLPLCYANYQLNRKAQQWITLTNTYSVRYGAWPNSPPRPAERPGAGRVILRFPAPAPGPARSPDGSPLKQVGRNGAPSRE